MFSSVGTPPCQPCQQSTHTGRAAQWPVWESEAETGGEGKVGGEEDKGGGTIERECVCKCLCEAREMQVPVQLPPLGRIMHTGEEVHKSRQLCVLVLKELVE